MADQKTIMIAGVEFTAPYKYAAGHALTEIEAKVLNQTRFENLRNNFASTVKASAEGKEGAVPADQLASKFAEYEASYEFAQPGTGTGATRLDPIEREAVSIATDIVKEKMRTLGKSWLPPKEASDEAKEAYKATRDNKVAEIAGNEAVIAQARKNVAARSKGLDALANSIEL